MPTEETKSMVQEVVQELRNVVKEYGKIPQVSVIYCRLEGMERLPDGKITNQPFNKESEAFSIEFHSKEEVRAFNKGFIEGLREYVENIKRRIRTVDNNS